MLYTIYSASQSVTHIVSSFQYTYTYIHTYINIQYHILNFERSEHGGFGGLPPLFIIYCLVSSFRVYIDYIDYIDLGVEEGGVEDLRDGFREVGRCIIIYIFMSG